MSPASFSLEQQLRLAKASRMIAEARLALVANPGPTLPPQTRDWCDALLTIDAIRQAWQGRSRDSERELEQFDRTGSQLVGIINDLEGRLAEAQRPSRVLKYANAWLPPGETVTLLYRLWGPDEDLLYIGITDQQWGMGRIKQHYREKGWFVPEVIAASFERVPARLARELEAMAIRTERPRYNIIHNRVPQLASLGREPAGCTRPSRVGEEDA